MAKLSRILLITRHCPFDIHDGSGAYVESILKALVSQGFDIHIAWSEPSFFLGELSDEFKVDNVTSLDCKINPKGYEEVCEGHFRKVKLHNSANTPEIRHSFLKRLRMFLKSRRTSHNSSNSWNRLPDENEISFFQSRIDAIGPDHIFANYAWISQSLSRLKHNASTFAITHDVWHLRQRLDGKSTNFESPISKNLEIEWLECAQNIVSISREDLMQFKRALPRKKHIYVPKPVSVSPMTDPAGSQSLLFVGSNNPANREGIQWFLENCWELITRQVPQASLDICGSVEIEKAPTAVRTHGRVPDLNPFYEKSAVVIVPLQIGSGMKIKLVEAAAFGKPFVSTSIGLQGLDFLASFAPSRDQPEAFAESVVELLTSPITRSSLQSKIIEATRAELSPEIAIAPLMQAMSSPNLVSQ